MLSQTAGASKLPFGTEFVGGDNFGSPNRDERWYDVGISKAPSQLVQYYFLPSDTSLEEQLGPNFAVSG